MAVEAKLLKSERDVFRGLEEIGKEKNDAAAMDQPNGLLQELGKASAAAGLQQLEMTEYQAELAGPLRRPNELRNSIVRSETDHSCGIVLPQQKPRQRRGQDFGAFHF